MIRSLITKYSLCYHQYVFFLLLNLSFVRVAGEGNEGGMGKKKGSDYVERENGGKGIKSEELLRGEQAITANEAVGEKRRLSN